MYLCLRTGPSGNTMLMLMRRLGEGHVLLSPLLPLPLPPSAVAQRSRPDPAPADPADARELGRPTPEVKEPLPEAEKPLRLSSHSGRSSLLSDAVAQSASTLFSWRSSSSDSLVGSWGAGGRGDGRTVRRQHFFCYTNEHFILGHQSGQRCYVYSQRCLQTAVYSFYGKTGSA